MRSGALLLLLCCVAGCNDLLEVPAPPVPLRALEVRAAAVGGAGPIATRPRTRLIQAVPPNALVTVHLPDIAGAMRRFKETALYRIFTSPAMEKAFGAQGLSFDAFSMAVNGLPKQGNGPNAQRLLKALQGECILCLEDVETKEEGMPLPRVLLGMTVRGAERDVEQLIEFVGMMAASDRGVKVEKGNTAGVGFTRFVSSNPPRLAIEAALCRDALLIGIGRETVTSAIDRLENRGSGSIDDDVEFQRSMERCSDPRDALRLHVDVAGLWARFGALIPTEPARLLRSLGFDQIKGLGIAARIEGQDIVVSTLLDSPGGNDFLTQLFSSHPVNRSFFDLIPAEASAFSIFAIDGPRALGRLREALPDDARKEMNDWLAQVKKSGVDVERDVLEVFGPRCAVVNVPFGDGTERHGMEAVWDQFLGAALMLEVQDSERAAAVLRKLPDGDGTARRRERLIEGKRVVSYRFDMEVLPHEFALCYALVDGYLVVGFSEEAIRKMIKPRSSNTADRFSALFKDAPDSVAVLSYDDMSQGFGITMEAMATAFLRRTRQPGDPDYPLGTLSRLAGELPASISYTVADDRGIFSFTRSPTGGVGSVGGLTGLFMIASVAIPNLVASRVAANESAAIATLRNIRTAQETFRANDARDADEDGEGEYGFLAELMGRTRRGETRPRIRTPLVTGLTLASTGDFERSGYYFRAYLPAEDGAPIGEYEGEGRIAQVDGDLAESVVVVVAWPVSRALGKRAFLLDSLGTVHACLNGGYEGENAPAPDVLSSQGNNIASEIKTMQDRANDGHHWDKVR